MDEQRLGSFAAGAGTVATLLVLTFAAAAIGGLASTKAAPFYEALERPPWAPPAAVFGPVWTVLYSLMALSAFLVVREIGWRAALLPIAVYVVQLILNAAWTWLFFGWRLGGAAFAEILVLVAVIALNVVLFWQVRPLAGALLLPYLGWTCSATVLTWALWRANQGALS